MKTKTALLLCNALISMSFATDCHAQPAETAAKSSPAEIQRKVEALKAKTLRDLVSIKGGTFMMGDFGPIDPRVNMPYSGERNDDVLHEVTLSDYSLGAYKITYADFDIFTASTKRPKIAQQKLDFAYRDLPELPAGVNWSDAQAYCQWIGDKIGIKMDLPTEAQWEFAARNRGKLIVWPTDNGVVDDGRNVANFDSYKQFEADHDSRSYFSSIGLYPTTPLGLHDMIDHGYEWMLDWYSPEYSTQATTNPTGPVSGTEKVQRSNESRGGDTLAIVSMTMTRFHSLPSPPPRKAFQEDSDFIPKNQNLANTFRCAGFAKSPTS